jgi:nitrogen fixation/metabolism regulation signal transduction histidine kinase
MDEHFFTLQEGENRKVSFFDEISEITLNIAATSIKLQDKTLKIVALTNIAADIAEAREESWQRMSRALTHEIMNTLAPVSSLSQSLLQASDPEMIHQGLEIINSAAGGLTKFVENYRSATRIAKPVLQDVDLELLVETETRLLSSEINIKAEADHYIISADKGQISQVLVNLIKNALEAVRESASEEAKVWIEMGRSAKGGLFIDVCNTGLPISDEVRDNIFVPFFTTKESGNGIGLSISRQIMRLKVRSPLPQNRLQDLECSFNQFKIKN